VFDFIDNLRLDFVFNPMCFLCHSCLVS
jgi:hypothetical protein